MKRIALLTVFLGAAAGAGYAAYPREAAGYAAAAAKAAPRVWDGIEANPVPVALALGTFLLTVVYHTAKGKSLRESVEVAATRVTVVPVPKEGWADENPVVRRAKARATRTQLIADQIGLENRLRKLPEAVVKAEKDACYTEQAVADAERALADRRKAHKEAVARLESLRKEQAAGRAELNEIEAELKKLAELV
jgi:hypothetical protein